MDTKDADGSRSSSRSNSSSGLSTDENHNLTHALQASVDELGNVKNHSVEGFYRNKKTGEYGNSEQAIDKLNADGTETHANIKNDTNRNSYEAEKMAMENTVSCQVSGIASLY